MLVRKARESDWHSIRELCCRTGDNGRPIERGRWEAFAEQWVGPYQKSLSDWSYVAQSEDAIVGYLTGCPDTRLGWRKGPEESFPVEVRTRLAREFPAHLHMNVEETFRGTGVGRRMVEAFVRDLRAAARPGLHVFCGPDPIPFYRRIGFEEVARIEYRPGIWVSALGLRVIK